MGTADRFFYLQAARPTSWPPFPIQKRKDDTEIEKD